MSYPLFMRMFLIGGIALFVFCLSGCGRSAPSRFYTLTSMSFPRDVSEDVGGDMAFAVRIGPVRVPDYLDRSQIVTRTSRNDLLLGEFDLWGGSLKADVERVLVENLSLLLRSEGVFVTSWKNRVGGSMSVPVVLNRFDVVPGKTVTLAAQWTLVRTDKRGAEIVRESTVIRPVTGSDYPSIVAAMSDALGELSKEVARTINVARAMKREEGDP